MAKITYYFSHDSNAKDDPKCMLLIDQLGLEGYGIYWVLIEILRDQPEYKYPVNLLPVLAKRYFTSSEKFIAVVRNYELFTIENDSFFFSPSLIDRMQPLEDKREKNRLAGIKSGESRRLKALLEHNEKSEQNTNTRSTDVEQTLNENEQSKVKESKVKKSKVKDSSSGSLSLTNRQSIFYEDLKSHIGLYSKETLRAFYDYWSEPNQPKTKMRCEMEKTWDTPRRLANWARREKTTFAPAAQPVTKAPLLHINDPDAELKKLAEKYNVNYQPA
jgi:hypothetical protein